MTHANRYDLRDLLLLPAFFAPDDPPAGPDPSPDDEDSTAGDVAGEGNQEPGADNPELKKLHDEAARHRVRAKDAEGKVTTLTETVRSLHLQLAFNAAASAADITDAEAAWKLAADDLLALDVAEDGTIDGTRLGQILEHVADRYPYLASPPPAMATTPTGFTPTEPSGSIIGSGRRKKPDGLNASVLEAKFPALRHRRR